MRHLREQGGSAQPPQTKAQRRFEMPRINRTNEGGEKASSSPF